jgi:tetratricopeptide (TPR) repeat protein
MGVVYEAEQLSLGRRVALKVLPFAATLDPRQLQRFQNEAQAAAQLHHGNIVPVYAVGCERGVHYYAMQFVEGQSLAAVIAALRQAAGPAPADATPLPAALPSDPARKGTAYFRAAAQLGLQAAEALEHAHQCGVVHRDIKPANLLIDPGGHLWVTDFGLARSASNPGLTLTGDVVGTLRYMSPEQALGRNGRIDHRTDIYALGVSLYELLTLEPAFAGADQQEVLRQIDSGTPRPPRRLDRRIPVELETIVLKAMEKDPAERYATAQDLADDLRRFLEDRPIQARRPSLAARGARWARRHQGLVGAAMAMVLLAVLGLGVSVVLISRERDEAVRQRNDAEAQRRLARGVVDDMYTNVAVEILAHQPRLQPLQREFLLRALRFYEQLAQERGNDPAVRLAMGRAVLRVAGVHDMLGDLDKAGPAFERAVAILEKLAGDGPDVRAYREALAEAYDAHGAFLEKVGERARAEQVTRQAITASEQLVREAPAEPVARGLLAKNQYCLAVLLAGTGQLTEAEALYRQGESALRKLAAELPDNPRYSRHWALSCRALGAQLGRTGRNAEAETLLRRALATLEQLTARSPQNATYRSDLADTADELGQLFWSAGRLAEADRTLDGGFEQRRRLAADFPDIPKYRHDLARGLNNRATLRVMGGRAAKAEGFLREARDLLQGLVAECPGVPRYRLDLAKCHTTWGIFYGMLGRYGEVEKPFRAALDCYELLAAGAPGRLDYREQVAAAQKNLAILFARTGQAAKSVETYGKARDLFAMLAADQPQVPHYRYELADVCLDLAWKYRQLGATREANETDRRALGLLGQLAGAFPKNLVYLRHYAWELANCGDPSQRDADRAIELARRAIELDRENDYGWRAQGAAYCRAGKWQEAAGALERSLKLSRSADCFGCYFLALARWHLGDTEGARKWYDKAAALHKAEEPHEERLHRLRQEIEQLFRGDGSGTAPQKEDPVSGK